MSYRSMIRDEQYHRAANDYWSATGWQPRDVAGGGDSRDATSRTSRKARRGMRRMGIDVAPSVTRDEVTRARAAVYVAEFLARAGRTL